MRFDSLYAKHYNTIKNFFQRICPNILKDGEKSGKTSGKIFLYSILDIYNIIYLTIVCGTINYYIVNEISKS